jgi:hypothetical protein
MLVVFASGLAALSASGAAGSHTVQDGGIQHAQRRPDAGKPVGGGISGRVVDAQTEVPLARAQVRASSADLERSWLTTTDANGRYVLANLPPGTYNVLVSKTGYLLLQFGQRVPHDRPVTVTVAAERVLESIDFRLSRAGVISGQVLDPFGEPQSDVVAIAFEARTVYGRRLMVPAGHSSTTNDLGDFRISGLSPGRYYVAARPRLDNGPFQSSSAERVGLAPTFYPGTTDPQQAQPITIEVGQQVAGTLVSLARSPLVRITGTLRDARGGRLTTASLAVANLGAVIPAPETSTQIRPDGSFIVSNVVPGEYVITVRVSNPVSGEEEFAIVPVTVGDRDLIGVDVMTGKPASLRGKVALDNAVTAPFDATRLYVVATAVPGEVGLGSGGRGRVQADWSFELNGLIGSRLIGIQGLPSDWAPKGAWLDVLDRPIEFKPNQRPGRLELLLTNRLTILKGTIAAATNLAADCSVVVFPQDRALWSVPARYVRFARADERGRFEIRGLPSGRYLGTAVPFIEISDAQDSDVLERLAAAATPFTIGEAESKSIQLTLSRYR